MNNIGIISKAKKNKSKDGRGSGHRQKNIYQKPLIEKRD